MKKQKIIEKPKKKHWATKLKEERAKVLIDIYKILDGDYETITFYKIKRKILTQNEHVFWMGEVSLPSKKNRQKLKDLFKQMTVK